MTSGDRNRVVHPIQHPVHDDFRVRPLRELPLRELAGGAEAEKCLGGVFFGARQINQVALS
eukprot:CAMPEP_0206628200 /NCGR_PEP_ID=MMETSP0325_2-20121206/66388_1 /ASSEMBLY_ACC=CAM_ASM_000347 /TAXON_ID=2866 /ORGANISM="Crypthecodinium cohnii, Strain Seligo" /LENGTH=60 /DNA_ID=CAMNT_0054152927 /DNA_START=305 /DNA_END=487 /DNA_ORIENTATION=+